MKAKKLILSTALITTGVILLYKSKYRLPKNLMPFTPIDMEKYSGKWYELAKIKNTFDQNITDSTLYFTQDECGNIEVLRQAFNRECGEFQKMHGKAFMENPDNGKMKIFYNFPFHTAHNIIAMDDNFALVAGKNLNQLSILSRNRTISEEALDEFLKIADCIGFDISRLCWIDQSKSYEEKFAEIESFIIEGFI